ncbi:hypothetical protein BCR35DRAFT_307623 [Leucosporidium creatinivorum]|uniref:Uncharacterized protein n=1 Tax=Leucosporidium creatinivorum TaxID=106004 RepID=A0A1Y2EM33_9BASI|nr:hypothetical protein BCR35DRAFT_307623 [Leucosporidium creatinivorum]
MILLAVTQGTASGSTALSFPRPCSTSPARLFTTTSPSSSRRSTRTILPGPPRSTHGPNCSSIPSSLHPTSPLTSEHSSSSASD